MKWKYTYILPSIYLLFFLIDNISVKILENSEASNLSEIVYRVLFYIRSIFDTPISFLISFESLSNLLSHPYGGAAISLLIYALVGWFIDVRQSFLSSRMRGNSH